MNNFTFLFNEIVDTVILFSNLFYIVIKYIHKNVKKKKKKKNIF